LNKAKLFVISAPSGAGKTSLVKALMERMPELRVAVSHTTRKKRPDEVDGVNYHFVDEKSFHEMKKSHRFIETARIFGNLYGTSQAEVDRILASGHNIVLEIDWQGAAQVRSHQDDVVSVFILPPSMDTLRRRLVDRGQDDMETISARLNAAIDEIAHYRDFDYLVVNDDFGAALDALERIIRDEPADLSTGRQARVQAPLLADLLS